ncbi:MAG: hypothetical protein EA386_00380 [Rhodobacteraceae bacterium]|nr:MAG: hypothetical protein EA386_00380 [Paracoccaceae bacterium]
MTHHPAQAHDTRRSAHLRAFIYADSLKPGRPALLRHPPEAIAHALTQLSSEDAARCRALLPAGVQIPVAARLDRLTRACQARDCADWCGVIPVLRAFQVSVASHSMAGQMTPAGRV